MPYKDPEVRKTRQQEHSKNWYEKNRQQILDRNQINRAKGRKAFRAFKATLSCTTCGENHPATLDFHHHTPHPANRKISALISDGHYARAMEEIAEKCIVLCSNCHRKYHYEENKKPPSSFT